MLLVHSQTEFVDERLSTEEFNLIKKTLPNGQVPVFYHEMEGNPRIVIDFSIQILIYLGKYQYNFLFFILLKN